MALGDTNYQGNNNKPRFKEPEVYSCYNMSNVEGIDPSALSFSFFRNLLKITISPKLQNPTGDKMWDHENAACVYLTHTKARMLAKEIEKVLAGDKFNGGVNTGSDGLISFSDGKEVGSQFYCIIIRKIDSNGGVLGTYVYEFKTNYHYAISNFNASDSTHDKDYYDMLEIEQLKDLLVDYYNAMTNAIAYSVINNLRFDMSRINTKLNDIAEANGIKYGNGNNYSSNSGSRSFFNSDNTKSETNGTNGSLNNGQSTHSNGSRTTTLDDLDGSMNS